MMQQQVDFLRREILAEEIHETLMFIPLEDVADKWEEVMNKHKNSDKFEERFKYLSKLYMELENVRKVIG